ncbi:MAG: hypothetical protein CML56_08540 [Rhodobacteraceae bacterium]|nr:hypothetical protein [Paracoccaceae bacterium]|tara:strand:+ start:732 stop:1316 length:585 start_codon:yes stop_codon:yes gene_type:complete
MNKLVIFLLAAIGLVGCKGKVDDKVEEPSLITWSECGYEIGDHICNLTLKDQLGNDFDLYENVGRPIILDYSTMWCGYCGLAAQEVDDVSEKYREYDLLYVTLLIENQYGDPASESDCKLWADNFAIENNPVLAASRDLIGTPGYNDGMPITSWPTFVFLREDLSIYSIRSGFSSQSIDNETYNLVTENEEPSN